MNRNDQQAYDRGTSLFSPDGRIYQVEYAREAVERGAPSVGIRATDGIVLAARKRSGSSLMVTDSIEKLHKIDDHVGTANAGHVADARKLIDFARQRAQVNRLRFEEPVGLEVLTKEITDHIQENTQRGGTRPYGAALIVAGVDESGPRLFVTEPSGTPQEWRAAVIGDGRDRIHDFLESEYDEELGVEDAISLAIRAITEEEDDEDLSPEQLAISVVTEDGYRELTDDDIGGYVASEE